MRSDPGVAADMFSALADAGINIEMISTSSIRISCVVRAEDIARAVRITHDRFNLSGDPPPATGGLT
jgi:aspartate kinase